MPAQTRQLKSAMRVIELLVMSEYQRLAPLVNTRLDTPMVENARTRKAKIDKAWTLIKAQLESNV